jgi:hypothetical protein
MPPKKASATGAAALQPLDPNQETLSVREARSQKRKATSPTPQEDELDQEIRNIEQERRPQHRELHREGFYNEDEWYEDFHHGNFSFDDASPLLAELQATPWPPSYKPPYLPMYDRHS